MTREEMLEEIGALFRGHGYEGTSLSSISEATGLGRASLYHHFPGGKEQMGREVFGHVGSLARAGMLEPLTGNGTPAERVGAWARGVERFYSGGRSNCLLGAMVLGGGRERYREEIRSVFGATIDALAAVIREAGVSDPVAQGRARAAVAAVQGGLVVARGLADENVFREIVRDLPRLLLAPTDGEPR